MSVAVMTEEATVFAGGILAERPDSLTFDIWVRFLAGAKMGGMTSDELKALKARLLKDMEGEIDTLVAARSAKEHLTLTEIEEVVLEARQRLGQKLAEGLIEMQERARSAEIPVSAVTGKRLHPKGKKTKR